MSNRLSRMSISIKGSSLSDKETEKTVLAEVVDQKLWYKIDDQIVSIDVAELSGGSSGRRQKQSANKKSLDQILAPMPGKITKILVDTGAQVKKSTVLLVMEAMKMEYTLKSDLDTTVERINVQVGDQVALGHLLIQLQKQSDL